MINLNFVSERSTNKKRAFERVLTGKIVKKYRVQQRICTITSRKICSNRNKVTIELLKQNCKIKNEVESFFEKDSVSRLTAGKKETKTKNKQKKQKRLLNDTMKNLYNEFIKSSMNQKISYSTFCKLRPFWVVQPDYLKRDTCLCIDHENFALALDKLYSLKMLSFKYPTDILKSLTCGEELKEACLERLCENCKEKDVEVKEFVDGEITYHQWCKKRVEVVIKGENKVCTKTLKEEVTSSKKDLLLHFTNNLLDDFMKHVCNIKHQFRVTSNLKKSLGPNDILIHCDFSENYSCKYSQEVQSLHFGGSRNQVSIHTVVVYYYDAEKKETKSKSYATFSDNRRHDFVGVCAHLKPVISSIKEKIPAINTAHFLSDSPSQQYRNKSIFYLIGTFFQKELEANVVRWHYTEKGHGKGAPDGIGGAVKRSADSSVGQGKDIPDLNTLVQEVQNKCPGITITKINDHDFHEFENLIPENLPTFKGTLKVHEAFWSSNQKNLLFMRRLSCANCVETGKCSHYGIGTVPIPDVSTTFQQCILLFSLSRPI